MSNIKTWWSPSLKPIQRAAAVSATKDLFTPSDNSKYKQIFKKLGFTTKASLQLSGIVECLYSKSPDTRHVMSCIKFVIIKYNTAFVCDNMAVNLAPLYVIKPLCFAYGSLSSALIKAKEQNRDLSHNDFVNIIISTSVRELEHWSPHYLEKCGITIDYSFYVTTLIESMASILYNKNQLRIKNTTPQICPANKSFSQEAVIDSTALELPALPESKTSPEFCLAPLNQTHFDCFCII